MRTAHAACNRPLGMVACHWLLVLAGCTGQGQPSAQPPLPAAAARTVVLAPLFVGDVDTLEHQLPVKNDTGTEARFIQVRRSCTCAGGTRLGAMRLAAGEQTILHFEVDIRHRHGPQRFSCSLVKDDGDEWVYSVETVLYRRAQFADMAGIYLGPVDPGKDHVRSTAFLIRGRNRQELPEHVSFESDTDGLSVQAGAAVEQDEPDGTVLQTIPLLLRLAAPKDSGPGQANMRARVEWRGRSETVQCGMTWSVRRLFTVTPGYVFFGAVEPDARGEVTSQLIVRRSDGRPVGVKGARVSPSSVRCLVKEPAGGEWVKLEVVLTPARMTGTFAGELTIETDCPEQGELRIPVVALHGSQK